RAGREAGAAFAVPVRTQTLVPGFAFIAPAASRPGQHGAVRRQVALCGHASTVGSGSPGWYCEMTSRSGVPCASRDVHLDASSAGPPGTRAGRDGLADSGTCITHEIIPDCAQRPEGIP